MIQLISRLKKIGVHFDKGLTKEEIFDIEDLYKIKFPPDFVQLYSIEMPISKGFINWRDFSTNNVITIKSKIHQPQADLINEVINCELGIDSLGITDNSLNEIGIIEQIKSSPRLIPIYSHRYLPTIPLECNNPIFSVYGSDIIYYGKNLCDYFEREFLGRNDCINYKDLKKIAFWSNIVEN